MVPIISPIQPTSNIMPSTPNEHLDKNTPAATPTDQQDSKSNNASPPASIEAPGSVEQISKQRAETMVSTPGDCGNRGNNVDNGNTGANFKSSGLNTSTDTCNGSNITSNVNNNGISNEMKQILSLLKRPSLISRDYEDGLDDDTSSRHLLYDYSTMDAWMNHPIKRYRQNDENKTKKFKQIHELYAAFENKTQSRTTNDMDTDMIDGDHQSRRNIKNEQYSGNEMMEPHEIKKEGDSDMDKLNMENLYISKGLMPSLKDLDQIFDTDDSPEGVRS